MAWDSNGGGGNDINWPIISSIGASARIFLVTGWWRATALTNTTTLWSAASAAVGPGAYMSGTGVISVTADCVTTDPVLNTDITLVVDEWRFLAFLVSTSNTGPSIALRAWSATVDTPPVEAVVTVGTAPAGNFTGYNTFYIGNFGTSATRGFPGAIENVSVISCDTGASAVNSPFGVESYGTITNEETLRIYETMLIPLWLGDTSIMFTRLCNPNGNLSRHNWQGLGTSFLTVEGNVMNQATLRPLQATNVGGSQSQLASPRRRHNSAFLPYRRR